MDPLQTNLERELRVNPLIIILRMGCIQSLVIRQSIFYRKNNRWETTFHQFQIHQKP